MPTTTPPPETSPLGDSVIQCSAVPPGMPAGSTIVCTEPIGHGPIKDSYGSWWEHGGYGYNWFPVDPPLVSCPSLGPNNEPCTLGWVRGQRRALAQVALLDVWPIGRRDQESAGHGMKMKFAIVLTIAANLLGLIGPPPAHATPAAQASPAVVSLRSAIQAPPVTLPVLTGTVKVMLAGDSTAGGHGIWCDDGSNTSFGDRWAMGDWMAVNPGVSFAFVGSQASTCHAPYNHHEGHGGATTGWLADHIAAYLTVTPTDVLILRVGVNDAMAAAGYHSAAQMLIDYKRLLDTARATSPGIRILINEPIPPNGSVSQEYAKASITIQQFNALLPALVATYGDSVRSSPTGCIILDRNDGLHPDIVGYLLLAWYTIRAMWSWFSDAPPARTDAGILRLESKDCHG